MRGGGLDEIYAYHKGSNTLLQQEVYELIIILDAELVNGVISASKGDEA